MAPASAETSRQPEPPIFPCLGAINLLAPIDRIQVSEGSAPAGGESYRPDAIVPVDRWRPCSQAEWDALASPARSPAPLNYVAVIEIPGDLRAMAERIAAGAEAAAPGPLASASKQEMEALARAFGALFGYPDEARSLGLLVQPGGKATTTLSPEEGKTIGLHVDSWFSDPPDQRSASPNRIALNLSREPRRLLLLDLGLDQILNLMRSAADPHPELRNPTEIGRAFLRRYPNYPVLSVEVRPGEAYVAATENLVHDGCTSGNAEPDIVFTATGRFPRDVAAQLLVRQGEPAIA